MRRQLPQGKVLLAVREDRVEEAALSYALNICKRVGAEIDLLLVPRRNVVPTAIAEFLERLAAEGVGYRLIRRAAPLGEAIAAHAKGHKDVLFVVIDSLESWGEPTGGASRRPVQPWQRLHCPLVVATR